MKVLLINSNRYLFPPVPPIGLEQVAGSLERGGHEVAIVDLCFSVKPLQEIDDAVSSFRPDVVGITVRNVDTVLYPGNEFFLDEIKEMVRHVRSRHGLKVIIGGVGLSTAPEEVLEYLGADYGVEGPGEDVINELIDDIARGDAKRGIYRRRYRYQIDCHRTRMGIDYQQYLAKGGIAGFMTHAGCTSSCPYCIEASTPVSFRDAGDVVDDIQGLVGEGVTRFHLCDPEFNEDNDYCLDFCEHLKRSGVGIDWAVYMKPANFSRRLMKLMGEAGVSLITLSVDSWKKCPLYWDDIQKMVFGAKALGIRIVVDFLTGFPYEEDEDLFFYLDLFRRIRPESVGINTYIRLYKRMRMTDIIMRDESLKEGLLGAPGDGTLLPPVFYNRISEERLRTMMGGDPLFRIEGGEKGVNYGRTGQKS